MVKHEHIWMQAVVVESPDMESFVGHEITVCGLCGVSKPLE